jgi:hypothetical protein
MVGRLRSKVSAFVCVVLCVATAQASSITISAVNNATVQPAGPRTGANGKNFFNIEGAANGAFASYGVMDIQIPTGEPSFVANTLEPALTQANAAFTTNGMLSFYITSDTSTSIDPGTSPLQFPTPAPALSFNLGSEIFTQVATGTVDQYIFPLTGALQMYVDNQITSGGILRVVIEPSDPNVAATWAGYTFSSAGAHPQLTLADSGASAPEPCSVFLFVIGAIPLVGMGRFHRVPRNNPVG